MKDETCWVSTERRRATPGRRRWCSWSCVLVYLLRSTLFVFTLALLFAYLLSPLVDLLDRALPKKRTRTLALALAYVIFVGAGGACRRFRSARAWWPRRRR